TRFYHGTHRGFSDFDPAYFGKGAGGDLYGPGIYMTDAPEIAGSSRGYAMQTWPEEARRIMGRVEGHQASLTGLEQQASQQVAATGAVHPETARWIEQTRGNMAAEEQRLAREVERAPHLFEAPGGGANVRPVYPNFRNPLDLREGSGMTSTQLAETLAAGGGKNAGGGFVLTDCRGNPLVGGEGDV